MVLEISTYSTRIVFGEAEAERLVSSTMMAGPRDDAGRIPSSRVGVEAAPILIKGASCRRVCHIVGNFLAGLPDAGASCVARGGGCEIAQIG